MCVCLTFNFHQNSPFQFTSHISRGWISTLWFPITFFGSEIPWAKAFMLLRPSTFLHLHLCLGQRWHLKLGEQQTKKSVFWGEPNCSQWAATGGHQYWVAFWSQVCWWAVSILDVADCELLNPASFGVFQDSARHMMHQALPYGLYNTQPTHNPLSWASFLPFPPFLISLLKIRVQYITGLNFMDLKWKLRNLFSL